MKEYCSYCGAVLEPNSKICTNCGKVVSSGNSRQRPNNQPQQFSQQGFDRRQAQQRPRPVPPQNQPAPQRVYEHPKRVPQRQPQYEQQPQNRRKRPVQASNQLNYEAFSDGGHFEKNTSSGKEKRSKLKPLVWRIIKIALVVAVLYFAFSFVRIFMVSHAGYDFDTQMKLTSDNYGDAMDNFFTDGSWKFSLFKNEVSYEGTKGGSEYVLTFERKSGQTVCSSLTIDGEAVKSDKSIETEIMGMFMAEKQTS